MAHVQHEFLEGVRSAVSGFRNRHLTGSLSASNVSAATLRHDYECAILLSGVTPTAQDLDNLSEAVDLEVGEWLLDLPLELAREGMAVEAAHLQRVWATIFERANFLGDRAVVLAEAGMRTEALQQIRELDVDFADDLWVQIKIGDALRSLNENDLAEVRFRRVLAVATREYDQEGARERLIDILRIQGRTEEAQDLERHPSNVVVLCEHLRTEPFLTHDEIDAISGDREYFGPYLRKALEHRAAAGGIAEGPADLSDGHAIFLLAEFGDTDCVPVILKCLRMSGDDMRTLYGDSLTEHFWLPFAKLGHHHLEALWGFAIDAAADLYARHAVVAGVVAMHHFHPECRAETILFIRRLLTRVDVFPVDDLAGILCDCADSGLMELADDAQEFASHMDDGAVDYPMATADDVRKAFREGPQGEYLSGRAHDVYAINREWARWQESAGLGESGSDQDVEEAPPPSGPAPIPRKIGRNDLCPCGSGKKFKKCHGR